MLDIFILAFWTDTTRIGTFMFGDAQSNVDYSLLPGVKGAFHSISHHGDDPEPQGAVRPHHRLAHRAAGVLPEPGEEPR